MSAFSKMLLAWRTSNGLTQKAAATKLGLFLPTYLHWEHGDRMPCKFVRDEITKKIGVDNAKQVGIVATSAADLAEKKP